MINIMINSRDVLGTAKIKAKNITHQQHRDARQQKDITARLAITAIIMIVMTVNSDYSDDSDNNDCNDCCSICDLAGQ